jgi:uncharacterized membrane protein
MNGLNQGFFVSRGIGNTRKEKMMNIGIVELVLLVFCGLAALGILAGGVILIVWLGRRSNKALSANAQAPESPAAALTLAQERYAKGEITREQYLQIVADLNQKV